MCKESYGIFKLNQPTQFGHFSPKNPLICNQVTSSEQSDIAFTGFSDFSLKCYLVFIGFYGFVLTV